MHARRLNMAGRVVRFCSSVVSVCHIFFFFLNWTTVRKYSQCMSGIVMWHFAPFEKNLIRGYGVNAKLQEIMQLSKLNGFTAIVFMIQSRMRIFRISGFCAKKTWGLEISLNSKRKEKALTILGCMAELWIQLRDFCLKKVVSGFLLVFDSHPW